MTNHGKVIHRWSCPWSKAFPDLAVEDIGLQRKTEKPVAFPYWRNAFLLDEGNLLAIYEGKGLVKLNSRSEVIWALPVAAHHDLWVSPDEETFYVLTRRLRKQSFAGAKEIVDNEILVVDSKTGTVQRWISLFDALARSDYVAMFSKVGSHEFAGPGEIFHANDIDVIKTPPDRVNPPFRPNTALVSMKYMNAVGLIDLSDPEFTWVMAGMTYQQHDPDLLPNGNLLIFDNGRHFSRVIEVDPLTQQIEWGYFGNQDNNFYSPCCGMNQRLANGNTLITETKRGRAFEVTPDGTIVWEFHNPHRNQTDPGTIPPLLVLKRFAFDYVNSWVEVPVDNEVRKTP